METFEVVLPSGKSLKGTSWVKEGSTRNLVMHTGMNEYSARYDRFALYLNEQGIDVHILDAEGQGKNVSSPEEQEKWTVGAFDLSIDCLAEKIKELRKQGKPVYLMGHSMGSFMVQRLLERYPHISDGVVICGSNGPNAKGLMSIAAVLSNMIVHKGNWDKPSGLLSNLGLGAYTKSVKDRKTDNDWLSYNEENVRLYNEDPYCGHRNTNGFWRVFLNGMKYVWRPEEMKKVSKEERIFIIAGDSDPVGANGKGPKALYDAYKKLGINDVALKIYPHMRHEIHNEDDYLTVYKDIAEFLK